MARSLLTFVVHFKVEKASAYTNVLATSAREAERSFRLFLKRDKAFKKLLTSIIDVRLAALHVESEKKEDIKNGVQKSK